MKKRIFWIFLVLAVMAGGFFGYSKMRKTEKAAEKPVVVRPADPYTVEKNIMYCTPDGKPQKLDVFTPANIKDNTPLVIHVHGGSWVSGKKSDYDMIDSIESLATAGFVVASIDYRLAPTDKFPAQIQDVKCAIKYMRVNAAKYHVDPNKIGLLGESAGAHLASLAATTAGKADFEPLENAGINESVLAVVDLFGPIDLQKYVDTTPVVQSGVEQFVGDYNKTLASPINYVTAQTPPFLIIHGDQDNLVPFDQSQVLYDKLVSVGVNAKLVKVKNGWHGLLPSGGGEISPSIDELKKETINFYIEKLGKPVK